MQRDGWCGRGRGRGLQIMTRITLCLHFQLSPIADFACVKDKLLQPSSYISHNFTPHSLFQFNIIPTFPPVELNIYIYIYILDRLFINSYSLN